MSLCRSDGNFGQTWNGWFRMTNLCIGQQSKRNRLKQTHVQEECRTARAVSCQIWTLSGKDWPQLGQIHDFSHQISKYTEILSEKVPDLSHFGPFWPNLDSKFDIPATITYALIGSIRKWHMESQWMSRLQTPRTPGTCTWFMYNESVITFDE